MSEARDAEAATRPVIDSLLGRSAGGGASKPPIPSLLAASSADGRPRVNWVPRRDREAPPAEPS